MFRLWDDRDGALVVEWQNLYHCFGMVEVGLGVWLQGWCQI